VSLGLRERLCGKMIDGQQQHKCTEVCGCTVGARPSSRLGCLSCAHSFAFLSS
jgi:hypothetical protein